MSARTHATAARAERQRRVPPATAAEGGRLGENASVAELLEPVLAGAGRPLHPDVRVALEPRLGHDLGGVRLHDDTAAGEAARRLDADAFTVGRDIVFARGRLDETAPEGRSLLAHELAHVVQQRSQAAPNLEVAPAGGAFEAAAELAATAGSAVLSPLPASAPSVQRQPASTAKDTGPKKPEITSPDRDEMKADVEAIIKELRSSFFTDEWKIVGIALKWDDKDRVYREQSGYEGSDFLDAFLLECKKRAYTRRTAGAAWVERWGIVYDDVWPELKGERLEAWKNVVAHSRKQGTTGPREGPPENVWKTISYQEAIGIWGILKGMGTGAAGVVDEGAEAVTKGLRAIGIPAEDPQSAAAWLQKQYDISGEAMFGKDWTEGDKLIAGMSAADIGTIGGGVIWQLVMIGAGGKGSPVWVQKALQAYGIVASLDGVAKSANQIAQIIAKKQTKDEPITVESLLGDPEFRSAAARLVQNSVAALSAGAGTNEQISKAAASAWLKASIVTDAAASAVELGNLSALASSNKPAAEKEKETAQVIAGVLVTVISHANTIRQHREASLRGDEPPPPPGEKLPPSQDVPPAAPPPAKKAPGLAGTEPVRVNLPEPQPLVASSREPAQPGGGAGGRVFASEADANAAAAAAQMKAAGKLAATSTEPPAGKGPEPYAGLFNADEQRVTRKGLAVPPGKKVSAAGSLIKDTEYKPPKLSGPEPTTEPSAGPLVDADGKPLRSPPPPTDPTIGTVVDEYGQQVLPGPNVTTREERPFSGKNVPGSTDYGREGEVLTAQHEYPDALVLGQKPGFNQHEAFDFVLGGETTTNMPVDKQGQMLSKPGLLIEGGTAISHLELDLGSRTYTDPERVYDTLANKIDAAAAYPRKSPTSLGADDQPYSQYTLLDPDKRVVHVAMTREPTDVQMQGLAKAQIYAKQKSVDLVLVAPQ